MNQPSSLLAACRHVAGAAHLSWREAEPIYRTLQKDGPTSAWLPTSSGRNIWIAQSKLVARFVIVLVTARNADEAHPMALQWLNMTASGEDSVNNFELPRTLEDVVAHWLVNPEMAQDITFYPDDERPAAAFSGTQFWNGPRSWLPDAYRTEAGKRPKLRVRRTVTLTRDFFVKLASLATIVPTAWPVRVAEETAQDD